MNLSKNLDLKDISNTLTNLGGNLSWVFLILFLILLAFEALEVNRSVKIILDSNKTPIVATKQQGVRINFKNYDSVIFRMGQAQSFEPSSDAVINPFGVAN